MMRQIRDYLSTWYQNYVRLESTYLAMIQSNGCQSDFLAQLFLYYFKLRLLRLCPIAVPWIRGMIWTIIADRFCQTFPPSQTTQSKKVISMETIRKIIKTARSLLTLTQSANFISYFPSIIHKPQCSFPFQVKIKFLELHMATFQAHVTKAAQVNNYEELVHIGTLLKGYSHIFSPKSDFAYVKSMCCYQDFVRGNGDNTRYCWCQKVINDDLEMVSCDKCESWYHYQCVGISQRKQIMELQKIEYMCPVCAIKNNQQYRYQSQKSTKRKHEHHEDNQIKVQKVEETSVEVT